MKQTISILIMSLFLVHICEGKGLIKETKGQEYKGLKSQRVFDFTNAVKIGEDYYVLGKRRDIEMISILIAYVPKIRITDFIIYKLDAKMNVKAVNVIPAKINDKDVRSFTIKRFGDKLCALFFFNNKKTCRQYLFAQMLDIETLEPDESIYKVGEISITKKEIRLSCMFRVDISSDNTKMLITADRSNARMSGRMKKAVKTQKSHSFSYWLIDRNFKLINSGKNVKMGKGGTRVIGQAFDNSGNMCFLGFEEEGGRTRVKPKKKTKKLDVTEDDLDYDPNKSKLVMKIIRPDDSETDLEFAKGDYFYSATLKLNPKTGNVAVVGLIASGKYGASGIFTQQVNLGTGEVLTESRQKFGVDLVKEINELKPLKSKKKGKSDDEKTARQLERERKEMEKAKKRNAGAEPVDYIYKLVRLGACHYNENNELVVVAQKYHTYTVTYVYTDAKGRSQTRTVRYFAYGDIISFKLNNEGAIENFGFIFHDYEYMSDIGQDYSSLFSGQKLFLISKLEACEMKLDNTVSKTEPFKELETYKKKRSSADYINVSDSELLHIMSRRRNVTFTLLSINIDNE